MGHAASRIAHITQKQETAIAFLSKHTFKDALGDVGKMVVIPSTYNVDKALAVLNGTEGGEGRKPVLSAPVVLDAYRTDMGLVDVMDLTQLLVKFSVFLRSGDLQLFRQSFFESSVSDAVGLHASDRVLPFQLDTPLSDVAEGMFRVGTHRAVAVQSLTDASSPIVAILSQTQLLCFMADHMAVFESHPETPLGQFRSKRLVTMRPDEPALQAFEKMQALSVSAIAVIDDQGRFINSVSASNVRLVTPENAHLLLSPVSEWIAAMNIKQANTASVATSFQDALQNIREAHLHRIWIVDADRRLVSVLTVGDVLRRFWDNAQSK